MKFTPKELDGNVNVSKTHPLAELSWLVGGVLALLAVLYLVLGLITDWAAHRIPIEAEKKMGEWALASFPVTESPALQQRLDDLLRLVPDDSPVHRTPVKIYRLDTPEINALALPGGTIIVFSGLIEAAESENELAMVLAHELGHIVHRDNLKGMGRGVGLMLASIVIFGHESSASQLLSNLFLGLQARYSQEQETAADLFGIDLLYRRYGHVGEATTFFERILKNDRMRPPALLATHPHPEDRLQQLEDHRQAQGYPLGTATPLNHLDFDLPDVADD